VFAPRQSYYTGYCGLHDMAFDKQIVLAVNARLSCISFIDGYINVMRRGVTRTRTP